MTRKELQISRKILDVSNSRVSTWCAAWQIRPGTIHTDRRLLLVDDLIVVLAFRSKCRTVLKLLARNGVQDGRVDQFRNAARVHTARNRMRPLGVLIAT